MPVSCCKSNCCDTKFEMRAGERQRFFMDLGEFLESIGSPSIDCVNWEAETPSGMIALDFEKGNYNPISGMTDVMISAGSAGVTYEVNAFINTCDGQRAQRCFQLYIQDC